jgi:hypothetical protein
MNLAAKLSAVSQQPGDQRARGDPHGSGLVEARTRRSRCGYAGCECCRDGEVAVFHRTP